MKIAVVWKDWNRNCEFLIREEIFAGLKFIWENGLSRVYVVIVFLLIRGGIGKGLIYIRCEGKN